MVVMMVLLTLIVCVGIDAFRSRRLTSVSTANSRPRPSVTQILERYYHPGHSWALVQGSGVVKIGVDDFTTRFLGRLDRVDVVRAGDLIHQGEPLVTLRHGNRSLTLVTPISGVVVDVNRRGLPERVNDSPYDKGWIAKISPSRLPSELCNLLRGALAEQWKQSVQAQVANWYSPAVGLVLQDGGRLIDNLGDLLTDEQWEELAETLFPKTPTNNPFESLV